MRMAIQLTVVSLCLALVVPAQEQIATVPVYRDLVRTLGPTQFVSGLTIYRGGSLELVANTPVRLAVTDGRLDIVFEIHGAFEFLFSAPMDDMSLTIVIPRSPSETWWELWGVGRSDVADYSSQFDSLSVGDVALADGERAVSISWADRSALYCARFEMTQANASAMRQAIELGKHSRKRVRLSIPTQ